MSGNNKGSTIRNTRPPQPAPTFVALDVDGRWEVREDNTPARALELHDHLTGNVFPLANPAALRNFLSDSMQRARQREGRAGGAGTRRL